MKTKSALRIAVVRGAAFAVITAVYLLIGGALTNYLWCVYLGFLMTMAFGAVTNQLPNYLFSFLIGYGWSVVYHYLPVLFQCFLPSTAAFAIAEFLVTGTLLFLHLRFLGNTWFNKVPAVFAAVATVFAFGGFQAIPLAAVSGCVGILMAVGTGVIIAAWEKQGNKRENLC